MAATSADASDRFLSLDVVRGVAVMGILTMNIAGFALIFPAYFNPLAQGDATVADRIVYLVNFVLFDGKMRGLFSMLFGASMLVVIERAEAKGELASRVHLLRMAWLLAFGLAHLWLVWWGDILSHYAIVGVIAFAFHRAGIRTLLLVGALLVLYQCWVNAGIAVAVFRLEAALGDPAGATAAAKTLASFNRSFGIPDAEFVARQWAIYRGNYGGIITDRFARHGLAAINDLAYLAAETLAYMLFGMAALKAGLLRGEWTQARYRRWAFFGFAIALPVYCALAVYLWQADFSLRATVLALFAVPTPVRPVMILGWACLILALMRPGRALTARIAAAGQMAFTNYLATSLICTSLFYGYGLGWFGRLHRAELYLVVVAVWAAMLLWSMPWLARHRYGPMEWLWRSLSRRLIEPMRRVAVGI